MSKECIGYNDITKQFVYMGEEKRLSLNARFDTKPEDMKINIWGYELCNGAEWKDFLDVVNKLGKEKADLEAKLAERCKEIAIRNKKLNELKNELHKRNESLERKKQQVGDVHKAVKQAKRESARKGRQVCYANNEVVQYQKQIRLLKQQLAEEQKEIEQVKKSKTYIMNFGDKVKEVQVVDDKQDKISFAVEQLEKVKEKIQEYRESLINYNNASEVLMADAFLCDCKNYIDNQIKQLKEMK